MEEIAANDRETVGNAGNDRETAGNDQKTAGNDRETAGNDQKTAHALDREFRKFKSVALGSIVIVAQWRSQGGARGAIAPPFFKDNVIKTFVIDVR